MRSSLSLALVAALLSAAPLAQAATVTTNDYRADSVDADPGKSCKELDLDANGNVTAKCNFRSTAKSAVTTKDTSLALESYAECQGGTLKWGSGGFIDNLSGADIGLSSNGKKYVLTGTCTHPTDATDTEVDDLPLDEKVGNAGGSFLYIAR